MQTSSIRTRFRLSLLLAGVLILNTLLLPLLSAAGRSVFIDNTIDDFSDGLFYMTQLTSFDLDDPPGETTGAIQLALYGSTPEWKRRETLDLPVPLSAMGAVALGNRIYVLGGLDATNVATDTVRSALVNTETGHGIVPESPNPTKPTPGYTGAWRTEESLPGRIVIGRPEAKDIPLSKISSPATASVVSPVGDYDYIYVIGGRVQLQRQSLSSYAVSIARVKKVAEGDNPLNGGKVEWLAEAGPPLPVGVQPGSPPLWGVDSASATTVVIGERAFIYVFGGLQVYDISRPQERPLNTVFYAEIDLTTGKLKNPIGRIIEHDWQIWERLDPLPIILENVDYGLYNMVAIADRGVGRVTYRTTGGATATTDTAIYVMGGRKNTGPEVNTKVYRALVDLDVRPGRLFWTTQGASANLLEPYWEGNMPNAYYQNAGTSFRGTFFLVGGRMAVNGAPQETVLASFLKPNLEFEGVTGAEHGNDYFLASEPNSGLRPARASHAVVSVMNQRKTGAFMYVIGGSNEQNQRLRDVWYAQIGRGLGDSQRDPYAPNGLYISRPFEPESAQPIIQGIAWNTNFPEGSRAGNFADIELEYRRSSLACKDAWSPREPQTEANLAAIEWRAVDGDDANAWRSQHGQNISMIAGRSDREILENLDTIPLDRCIQYRATLKSGEHNRMTPALINVSAFMFESGSPDLRFDTFEPVWSPGSETDLESLKVVIKNEYEPQPDQTEAAYIDTEDSNGFFFVDMFILPEGQQVFTPTLPMTTTNPTIAQSGTLTMEPVATSQVRKGDLGAPRDGVPMTTTVTLWNDPETNEELNITDLFSDTGTYTICIAIDSFVDPESENFEEIKDWGLVKETWIGAEENNFDCISVFVTTIPRISIATAKNAIAGGDAGAFELRSNRTSQANLVITLAIDDLGTGAAAIGTDYQLFIDGAPVSVNNRRFTVTIPSGQRSVTIEVRAQNASAVGKTVDLQIVEPTDESYATGGTTSQASLSIIAPPPVPSYALASSCSATASNFTLSRTLTDAAEEFQFSLSGTATYRDDYTINGTGATITSDVPITGTVTMPVSGILIMGPNVAESVVTVVPSVANAEGSVDLTVVLNGEQVGRQTINLPCGGMTYPPTYFPMIIANR